MELANPFGMGGFGLGSVGRIPPGLAGGGGGSLPYSAPPLSDTPFDMASGYTAPGAATVAFEFPKGSIVNYAWLSLDAVPFEMASGYTAPAANAVAVDIIPV